MVKFRNIQKVNIGYRILELESFWNNESLATNYIFRTTGNKPIDSTLMEIRCSMIKSVLPTFITTSNNAFPTHTENLSA